MFGDIWMVEALQNFDLSIQLNLFLLVSKFCLVDYFYSHLNGWVVPIPSFFDFCECTFTQIGS